MAQDMPFYETPLSRDCYNHKRTCTLVSPYITIKTGISSSSFVWVSTRQFSSELHVQGNFKHTQFSQDIGTDGTQTRNLSHQKQVLYWLS